MPGNGRDTCAPMRFPHANARAAKAFAVTEVVGVLVMAGNTPWLGGRQRNFNRGDLTGATQPSTFGRFEASVCRICATMSFQAASQAPCNRHPVRAHARPGIQVLAIEQRGRERR